MKPNYFTIHPNAKKHKIPKRKTNPKLALALVMGVLGAAQIEIIKSQPMTKKQEKELAIFETIINTANAMKKALQFDHLQNFKLTGRYGRKII